MNPAFENLNAKVTITDHDSRIFRFNYQSATNEGKFLVEYMFLIMESISQYYNYIIMDRHFQ